MLGNFSCGRYRFVLRADTPVRLNAFAGSTLRGGFGHVFKRTVCTWPPSDCPRCLLKTTCSYPYVFETAPPPGAAKLRSIDQIPRPYVIEPPEEGREQRAGVRDQESVVRSQASRVRARESVGRAVIGPTVPNAERAAPAAPDSSTVQQLIRSTSQHLNASTPQRLNGAIYRAGERFDFHLVLIGRAIDYLPYFLFTFIELGRVGLGPDRGRYTVAELYAEGLTPISASGRGAGGEGNSDLIYSASDGVLRDSRPRITETELLARASALSSSTVQRFNGSTSPVHPFHRSTVTLHFLTPTRIKSDGSVRAELTFQDLIRALLRRLSSLCYFHCGFELQLDFRGLIDQAANVRTVSSHLRWHDQERVSGRQHRWIDMGGVVGTVTFEADSADVLGPYMSLLAAGELVHVGKGAVMGLGKYRVEFSTAHVASGHCCSCE